MLYYVAENLSARAGEFARRLRAMTGASARAAEAEVEASIRRAFFYAGYADKFDGAVHATRSRFVTLAMNEPWGVMGIVCPDEAPLLAFVSLVMPAIAMGNCVIAIPSASHPLSATDFYSILDTSDVPGGVVNIVTGEANALAKTLAEHDGVDALWYVGDADGAAQVEALSAGNLKATWVSGSADRLATSRGPRIPAPGDPGQEHLDPLRGMSEAPVPSSHSWGEGGSAAAGSSRAEVRSHVPRPTRRRGEGILGAPHHTFVTV